MTEVALSEKDEILVRKQIESGRYANAGDVVTAALALLAGESVAFDEWFQDEIPGRLKALRDNPDIGIPLKEVTARIEARHRALAAGDN